MGADKNSPREQGLCPEFNPTHLSSNRQSDTRQQVTSSPYERLGKALRKAEASESNLLSQTQHKAEMPIYQSAGKTFLKRLAKYISSLSM